MGIKAKIYGAGSIGNHLAQASRRAGWEVVIVDPSADALRRAKEEIYPSRYGAWDEGIKLYKLGEEPVGGFDVIFLGTPPDARMPLAKKVLAENPRVLQMEKPVCSPGLEGVDEFLQELEKHPNTKVVNGYEYALAKMIQRAQEILKSGIIGDPQCIDVEFREIWKGIFAAHPWLKGPEDTYLGFWRRGGGASGEHSHATNLWQIFAETMGLGKVKEVYAALQMIKGGKADYDESCFITLATENGFIGRVVQDVITNPVKMQMRVQAKDGFVECIKSYNKDGDMLRWRKDSEGDEIKEEFFAKKRPDDFYAEISHIQNIMDGKIDIKDSPISLKRGLDTMLVVAAAHKSNAEKRVVKIDYSKGYNLDALI